MNRFISSLLLAFALSIIFIQPVSASSPEKVGKYVESLGNEAVAIISSDKLSKD